MGSVIFASLFWGTFGLFMGWLTATDERTLKATQYFEWVENKIDAGWDWIASKAKFNK
jgi:hypothetical protein